MKIISICGSPKKGNSEAILNRLKQIFEENGIKEVSSHSYSCDK